MSVNMELMLSAVSLYESRADAAFDAGKGALAKQNYLLAADALEKVAKQSDGALKKERLDRVERLKAKAGMDPALRPKAAITETASAAAKSYKQETAKSECAEQEQEKQEQVKSCFMVEKRPSLRFNDIAGLDTVKEAIKEAMLYPFEYAELYKAYNQKAGGGVLLYGLPGNGKTMLARAAAGELDADFFNVKCGALKDKYFGESEKNIRELFDLARKSKRAIMFFDEFDEIAMRSDNTEENNPTTSMVNELLRQMDGFEKNENSLFFLAATNRPWVCSSALTRPGRFGTKICIPPPDMAARRYLIGKKMKSLPTDGSIAIEELAEKFDGYSGADIGDDSDGFFARLNRFVIKDVISSGGKTARNITMSDVESVFEKFKSSINKDDIIKLEQYRIKENLV